jgi:signal recognition particle subunit SRP19
MQKEEMRENKQIIIWPVYLDAAKARNEGRLAPVECSVKTPKVSEIFRAAEKMGLHPEIVKDKAHPAAWADRSGMVVVDNKGPKTEIIRKIGTEIIRLRGGKQ